MSWNCLELAGSLFRMAQKMTREDHLRLMSWIGLRVCYSFPGRKKRYCGEMDSIAPGNNMVRVRSEEDGSMHLVAWYLVQPATKSDPPSPFFHYPNVGLPKD